MFTENSCRDDPTAAVVRGVLCKSDVLLRDVVMTCSLHNISVSTLPKAFSKSTKVV